MTLAATNYDEDAEWDRQPTALEIAHYNSLLLKTANEASERARKIFGECLLKLTQLGMREGQARSMLGKWRGQAKDDARLISVITKAHEMATPDPVSYVTKALKGSQEREAKTVALQKSSWTLLGWEPPRFTAQGVKYKTGVRGQVWRDPFGKETVLPPKPGVAPPSHEQDPGYQSTRKNAA